MSEAVFLANVNKQMNENLEDQIEPAVANFKWGHVPSIIWMAENKRSKIFKRNPKRHYRKN